MNVVEVVESVHRCHLHQLGGKNPVDVKYYLRMAGNIAEYTQSDDMMVVLAAGSTTSQLID